MCSGRVTNEIDQSALQHIAKHEQHRGNRNEQDERIEMQAVQSTTAMNMAMVIISPWAKLTTRTTPKMTDSPSAIRP